MHIVNGLDEARIILTRFSNESDARSPAGGEWEKGEMPHSIQLVSPPYAACHAGMGYYAAMLQQLREEFSTQAFTFWVCCGDDAATAHAALKSGLMHLICAPPEPMLNKLRAVATELMAEIRGQYPDIEIAEERTANH